MDFLNKYIDENDLILKVFDVKNKYFCTICKNILCQPKLSICGCSYCSKCISRSLESDSNRCPNCKGAIDAETDLYVDIRIKNKVSELKLECPNLVCEETVAVKDMENHIKTCQNKGYKCIFNLYGCSSILRSKDDLKMHLNDNLDDHLYLLLRNNQEISNSVDFVRNINIENIQKFNDLENRLDKTNADLEMVKDQMPSAIMNDNSSTTNMATSNLLEELSHLNEKLEMLEIENQELKSCVDEIETKLNMKVEKDMEVIRGKIGNTQNNTQDQSESVKVSPAIPQTLSHSTISFNNLQYKNRDIDHFSETITLKQYSFQIRLRYNNSKYDISITLVQIPNKLIHELEWPMPLKMSITLMAANGTTIRTRKFDYTSSKHKNLYGKPNTFKSGITDSNIVAVINNLGNKCSVKLCVD